MKVLFISLGCDKNLVDSEVMLGLLSRHGYEFTDDEEEAEAVVINTCCFISDAKEESVNTILDMAERRKNGQLQALLVTGCLAQRYSEEMQVEIPEVDAVLGTTAIDAIADALDEVLKGQQHNYIEDINKAPQGGRHRVVTTGGYYAYLKIAEGCDKHCTYCIIPKVRGDYRSVPMEQLLKEAKELGYLLKKPNGDVWQWDLWQAGMGIVDFTNPGAWKWYQSKLRHLLDQGVDCFKTDFGERIPTDVVYYDGSDPLRMHNYYTYLYNKVVFDVVKDRKGEGEAILFARSATVGGQQFPVHWGGDNSATYISMAETLRAGLSMSHSGFGYWSHDISGFESTAPADVYKRWVQFGLLSSHSRLHGSTSYRVPWLFDEESVDVCRKFTKLKCRLMPYLYGKAVEAHEHGVPMMRPMMLEFPDDPACDMLDRQYMLGDSLLVAPIFRKDGEVQYYLPDGTWTSLLDGGKVEGGHWQTEIHDFMSLPLMVRPGTVLPLGAHDDRPDYDYLDGVELHVYQLADGESETVEIPDTKGNVAATFTVTMKDGQAQVETDSTKPYTVVVHS